MAKNRTIKITIITDPIPIGIHYFIGMLKKIIRDVRAIFKPLPVFMQSPYRGHFAVTRSLVEGFQKLRISYNYNPKNIDSLADTVVVLAGVEALKQAIWLKKKGYFKKLLAGPNLVTFPSDADGIIASPEVDICITPGPLTCNIYEEDCPSLAGRLKSWPAGVDTNYWKPNILSLKKIVIIYFKNTHAPKVNLEIYQKFIAEMGYEVVIIRYGEYTKEIFLNFLQKAVLMIGISGAESQGITWSEAWSADVPTFLWYTDTTTYNHHRAKGRLFKSTPSPYLTDQTGLFFNNLEDFKSIFLRFLNGEYSFQPRQWVIENMSDEVCALNLLKIADITD